MVLEAILEARHRLTLSTEGLEEWRRHRSGFAQTWLVRMFSRKLVDLLGDVRDEPFRVRLQACAASEAQGRALEEDAHLVEAALRADRIVISRDEEVRALFRIACLSIREVQDVLWANPDSEDEQVVAWLEAGARREAIRALGHGGPA